MAVLVGPRGEILVGDLKPESIPASVRDVLTGIEVDGGLDGPAVEPGWGEPGLTPAERVFACLQIMAGLFWDLGEGGTSLSTAG